MSVHMHNDDIHDLIVDVRLKSLRKSSDNFMFNVDDNRGWKT